MRFAAALAFVLAAFLGGIPIDTWAQESPFAAVPAVTDGCTTEQQVRDFAEAKAGHPLMGFDFTASAANRFIKAANDLGDSIPPLIVDAAFSIPFPPEHVSVLFMRKGCVGPLLVTTTSGFLAIVHAMPVPAE